MTIIRACLFKFKHSIDDFKITLEEKRNEIDSNKTKLRAQVNGANETTIIRIENLKRKWNHEKSLNGDIQSSAKRLEKGVSAR